MKIDKNSLLFKVIIPIFLFVAATTIFLLYTIYSISKDVREDYYNFMLSVHSREIQDILDRAANDLITAQLFDKEVVVEAKKKATADEISSYWTDNKIEGLIAEHDGKIIYSNVRLVPPERAMSFLSKNGNFSVNAGALHIHGYTAHFPMWNWKIVTVTAPKKLPLYKNTILFLFPLTAAGMTAMLIAVLIVLEKRFHEPLMRMIIDLKEGFNIKKTGISELDTIGSAVNDASDKLHRKTAQSQTLHSIAISLHEYSSTDEILNLIIDKASELINAELAAVALYDDKGKFKKIITRGITINRPAALPDGKGVLEFMRLSVAPVRIDNLSEHPAFSGSFPEGHPVINNLLGYPIFSEGGRPIGALYFGNKAGGFTEEDELILKAISADTAIAINKAESLLQLRRFKQVIDSAFDVIVITDAEGHITYVNPAFEALTEYSTAEVIGKKTNILKSGYHDNTFYKKLWDTIKAGDVWKGEFANRKKSGDIYYASAIIFPIYTEGGVNYASIQRDITQEKRLYEQLLRAQKMEAIGTLAGGIAHDFNNLLTAILGYSEIMLSFAKEGDEFHRPATIIFGAAEKGAELAKKILTVTRKEKIEAKPVDINDVIKNSLELLQRSISKNINIVTNLPENMPLIKADPTQIQQVIMNLAVNARDAMPEGGTLTIETSSVGIENGAASDLPATKGGFVRLAVSDTGTGMNVETQRRIFDPFFTTKETGKGTGLGLYIVHSVVNNHGGYINLYSEPDRGTRFNIYFPVARGEETETVYAADYNIRGAETILIIDDDNDIRELCKDMLEPLGYKVLTAGSGSDGINIFREKKNEISLVILDMIMPKMGGSEAFHALKNIKFDVKVLLCSGYSHDGFAGIDKLLKSGAKSFIQKPFTRHTIAGTIRKALSA